MSVVQLMVTIIIVTILVTVILGVVSYGAYFLRRARRPEPRHEGDDAPRFFYRYEPEGGGESGVADGDAAGESAAAGGVAVEFAAA